jgi:hypothetical protein
MLALSLPVSDSLGDEIHPVLVSALPVERPSATGTGEPAVRCQSARPGTGRWDDESDGRLDYWFGEAVDPKWIDDVFVMDTQVGEEDTALVEAAQRGSSTGLIERGWVLGGAETLIGYCQAYVRERVGLDEG